MKLRKRQLDGTLDRIQLGLHLFLERGQELFFILLCVGVKILSVSVSPTTVLVYCAWRSTRI